MLQIKVRDGDLIRSIGGIIKKIFKNKKDKWGWKYISIFLNLELRVNKYNIY